MPLTGKQKEIMTRVNDEFKQALLRDGGGKLDESGLQQVMQTWFKLFEVIYDAFSPLISNKAGAEPSGHQDKYSVSRPGTDSGIDTGGYTGVAANTAVNTGIDTNRKKDETLPVKKEKNGLLASVKKLVSRKKTPDKDMEQVKHIYGTDPDANPMPIIIRKKSENK